MNSLHALRVAVGICSRAHAELPDAAEMSADDEAGDGRDSLGCCDGSVPGAQEVFRLDLQKRKRLPFEVQGDIAR